MSMCEHEEYESFSLSLLIEVVLWQVLSWHRDISMPR